MAEPRYFAPDHPEGITRAKFRLLPYEQKREVMKAWFLERYEDPAEKTPYESAEGGYIYIWGGPYDAREELEAEFGGFARQTLIDELVEDLERRCIEWAPVEIGDVVGPDEIVDADEGRWPPIVIVETDEFQRIAEAIDRGVVPQFGSREEHGLRAEIVARLERLEAELERLKKPRGMIGHNRPPEPIDTFPIGERDRRDLQESVVGLRTELPRPEPNVQIAVNLARKLRGAFSALRKWAGSKLNIAIDSYMKAFGETAGKLSVPAMALLGVYGPLSEWIGAAYYAVVSWLKAVMFPF